MSQTVPAPRPVSRRSSRSPPRYDQPLPTPRPTAPAIGNGRLETNMASNEAGNRPQQIHIPPRALGVHNILNPSESRLTAPDGGPTPTPNTGPPSAPYNGPRPFYPGQPTSGSHPGTPAGTMAPLGRPPSSGRNSPAPGGYPFPSLSNGRKILSPKPPRPSSLGHAGLLRDVDTGLQPGPGPSPVKRSYDAVSEADSRPQHELHAPGRPHLSSGQDISRSRSFSQPGPRQHEGPPNMPPGMFPRDGPGRPQSIHGQPSFHPGVPVSRPESSMGRMNEGAQVWPEMLRRSGMGGVVVGSEGQQAFMTLPGSDTMIPVQVDYSQASKKADEKRQRNAKASTRHRRKKKTLQEENVKQLEDLRDERHQMADQIEALTQQRDFYRSERNRLRDVIARTPAIGQHANGPPSPSSPMSSGSYADRSPNAQPRHMPTHSQGYASEGSSIERPSQRRRTDDHSDYAMPGYGTPSGGQPAGLATVPGQGYGGPPRPHSAASSASGERLPPLRAMEGPPPGSALNHGPPHEQDPRTGHWRPMHSRQYETGWATMPRKAAEGPTW